MLLWFLCSMLVVGLVVEFSLGAMKSRQLYIETKIEKFVFPKALQCFCVSLETLLYFLVYLLFGLNWVMLVAYLFEVFSLTPLAKQVVLSMNSCLSSMVSEFINEPENFSRLFKLTGLFINCLWATKQIVKNKQGSFFNSLFLSLTLFSLILVMLCYANFDNLKFQEHCYSLLTFSLSFNILKVYSINHWLTYVGCFIILTIYLCLPLLTIVFLFFFRSSTYFVLVQQSLVMNFLSKVFIVMISSGLHYAGQYCGLPTVSQLWAAISKFNFSSFYNQGVFNNIIWDSWFCQIKLSPTVTMVNEAFMKVHQDYYQYIRYLPDQQQMYTKLSAAVYKVDLLEANQLLQELKQTVALEVVPFVMTELQTTTIFGLLAFLLLGILLALSGNE